MIAMALVVVGSLVQVVAKSGGFGGARSTTGDGPGPENRNSAPAPKESKTPAPKPRTVDPGDPRASGTR